MGSSLLDCNLPGERFDRVRVVSGMGLTEYFIFVPKKGVQDTLKRYGIIYP
jgi:hypothetical protein